MSRKYTVEQGREALRLSHEFGSTVASDRMGIPKSSFYVLLREARERDAREQAERERASRKRARAEKARRPEPPGPIPSAPPAPPLVVVPASPEATAPAKKRGVARLYTPSQKAEAIELAAKLGVTAASERLGISRFSIHEWRDRLEKAAQGKAPDPTSGPDPKEVETRRDREILSVWKEHPGLGPSQVSNQLRRKGVKVAVGTTRKVMEDAGYRPKKVRRDEHSRTYEAIRPNHMWHLDFVHRYIGKTSTFNLFLLDDHSRFVTGFAIDDAEHADTVIDTFLDATTRHGRPEFVVHDKGSAFWSWNGISRFTDLLTEMGIDQIAVTDKETNGKSEVFNANLHKEFWDVQRFVDVASMRQRLASHLDFYNHQRTHQSLGGLLVPADRYFGRSAEVLARIEQGGLIDKKDPLDLLCRVFDLFRVTSHGGRPEVWLMGTKILGA